MLAPQEGRLQTPTPIDNRTHLNAHHHKYPTIGSEVVQSTTLMYIKPVEDLGTHEGQIKVSDNFSRSKPSKSGWDIFKKFIFTLLQISF